MQCSSWSHVSPHELLEGKYWAFVFRESPAPAQCQVHNELLWCPAWSSSAREATIDSCLPLCGVKVRPRDTDAEYAGKSVAWLQVARRSSSGIPDSDPIRMAPPPQTACPGVSKCDPRKEARMSPCHLVTKANMPHWMIFKLHGSHQDLLPSRSVRLGEASGDRGRLRNAGAALLQRLTLRLEDVPSASWWR